MSSDAELEAKIIDALYRGCSEPREFETAVELIRRRFDSAGAILFEIVPGTPEPQFTIGAGAVNPTFMANYAPFAELDPAPARFAAMPTGTASTTNRMFSAEFLQTNIF